MPQRKPEELSPKALQDYLETLATSAQAPPDKRERELMVSYAELQYRLKGGGKCSLCRAPVRHVMAVSAKREDGTVQEYDCLCTRCLEAERASKTLTLRIGQAVMELRKPEEKPAAKKFKP